MIKQANYDVKKFTVKEINEGNVFEIPKFQRGISWNKEKRKKFIQTVREGKPFGTILIYKQPNDKYMLVDGLQRISTLNDYNNNFTSYLNEIINDNQLTEIYDYYIKQANENENVTKKRIDDLKKILITFLKNNNTFKSTDLAEELIKQYNLEQTTMITLKMLSKIESLINDYNNEKNIDNFLVPAIIYKGEEEDLPDIFERINTGSVALSKYEVLAASWSKKLFKINDEEIKKVIKNKYLTLQDKSDIELQFNVDDIDNEINFFEYCYSIGILMHEKAPEIFGKIDNPDKTDSLGFDMLCLIFKLEINNAAYLIKKIDLTKTKFLIDIKNLILESTLAISNIIKPFLKDPNGSLIKINYNYMFFHMIKSYINNNYTIDYSNFTIEKTFNKEKNKKFSKYLPGWLIYLVITKFWESNRQVTDLSRLINNQDELEKYTQSISSKKWYEAIFSWIKDQNSYQTMENIRFDNKLFLNFIYKIEFSKNELYRKSFDNKILDIEHIIPKKRVENIKKNIPISSIANLCYMTSSTNRTKKDKTVYEYTLERPELNDNGNINYKLLNIMNYPEKSELSFLDYGPDEKINNYKIFINNRANFLSNNWSKLIFEYYLN